jgi:hypothetical protein
MRLKNLLALALITTFTSAFCQTSSPIPFINKTTGSSDSTGFDRSITDAFLGFGFVLGTSNKGATVNLGQSREFVVGVGLGRKLVKWNGLGIDLYYKSTGFYLKQDSTKILPNNVQHKDEKISFDNIGALVYDRFYIGSFFVDGGFYFDWTFYTKHITWDNYPGSYGSTVKVIEKQLNFTNMDNYGLTFRAGQAKGVSLYFNYRLSKLFKGASTSYIAYPELPVYVIGIVAAIH